MTEGPEPDGPEPPPGAAAAPSASPPDRAEARAVRPPRTWRRLKLALLALSALAPFPLVGAGIYQGCQESRRSEREHRVRSGLDRLLVALVRVVDARERLDEARRLAALRPGRTPSPRELAELVQAEALSAHEAALIAAMAGEPTVEDRAQELDAEVAAARDELDALTALGLDRDAAEVRVLALEASSRGRGNLGDVAPLGEAVDLVRARDGLPRRP